MSLSGVSDVKEATLKRSFPSAAIVPAHVHNLILAGSVRCITEEDRCFADPHSMDRLFGLVVKASDSRAEDPGFESRLRRDFFGFESYQ